MVLPVANEPDLERLPDEVREGLEFLPVREMDEVLDAVLAGDVRSTRASTSAEEGARAAKSGIPADPGISLSQ